MKRLLLLFAVLLPLISIAQKDIYFRTAYLDSVIGLHSKKIYIGDTVYLKKNPKYATTDTSLYKILYIDVNTGKVYMRGGSTGSGTDTTLWKAGTGTGSIKQRQGSNTSSGLYSIATGSGSVATGTAAMAFGAGTANGNYSIAGASGTTADGLGSVALGVNSWAQSEGTSALGFSTAHDYYETAIGFNNSVSTGSKASWNATDMLFQVGNGYPSTPSSCLQILKSGKATFKDSLKTFVSVNTPLITNSATNGNILITPNGTGNVGMGGATAPLHNLAIVGSNTTNYNMLNLTSSTYNKNRTTLAQAIDTSSISFNLLTGKPRIKINGATGNSIFQLDSVGNFGIGATPSAKLTFSAGSATANTAPLKFTSGTLLTQSEIGVIEFNSDDYYASITTPIVLSTSQYPSPIAFQTVKATTYNNTHYYPMNACNPALPLTGDDYDNDWRAATGQATNQRFNIDLGSGKIVDKIYYENAHALGSAGTTAFGAKNFTFYGSNSAADFLDTTYASTGTWVALTAVDDITGLSQFTRHSNVDASDPKTATVTNTNSYRYYSFKFADNWGGSLMSVRRIELQTTSSNYRKGILLNNGTALTSGTFPVATTNGRLTNSYLSTRTSYPNILRNSYAGESFMEFQNTNYTPMVSVGCVGNPEANLCFNMDYATAVHKYYNSSSNATWIALNTNGFYIQYAPSGYGGTDIWTGQGSPYLFTATTTGIQIGGSSGNAFNFALSIPATTDKKIALERQTNPLIPGKNLYLGAQSSMASTSSNMNAGITYIGPSYSSAASGSNIQIPTGTGFTSTRITRTDRGAAATTDNQSYDAFMIPSVSNFTKSVCDSLFSITVNASTCGGVIVKYTITSYRSDSLSSMTGQVFISWARAAIGAITTTIQDVTGNSADAPTGITDMSVTWVAGTSTVNNKVTVGVTVTTGIGVPTSNKILYSVFNNSLSNPTQL